ncbi:related to oxidoreductase [Rhynchosporium agropyri]|uniref:Related to oxidoreductase n=1 Tax=Rhynchosporium agropyri TaxID=914238 RepID=A0A1E1KSK2_9HELO|nr:related to oxidoreductase [Rhynchosporium agropyri]
MATTTAKRAHGLNGPDEIYKSQSIEQSLTPPKTPPHHKQSVQPLHPWPEPETAPEEIVRKRRKTIAQDASTKEFDLTHQNVLLLHAPKQRYEHTTQQPIPELETDREMLVEVEVVGLNPIDWKAPDFGWGLPALPCISGRDLAGKVVRTPKQRSRFSKGDTIMAISTDYRDNRKAAYQQYAIASDFNACRLPDHVKPIDAAPLGVAFVAAALALGICMGMDFGQHPTGPRGPNLLRNVQSVARDALPKDIHKECYDSIKESEGARAGDWIAIWGGSSASGCCAVQLAKLAGLKVIAIIDVARNGERMLKHGADLLVDRLDSDRAVEIVKSITKGKLRFGLDTRGKDSAKLLASVMQAACKDDTTRAHLVGLTGIPKEPTDGVVYHSVPIKAFHEAPTVGEGLMIWLEKLLDLNLLRTPDIEIAGGGLEGINAALDRLRDGSVNGPRIVVPLKI